MKQNEIKDNQVPVLGTYNYEHLFNVYIDEQGMYFYNLLKNVYFPKEMRSDVYTTIFPNPNEFLPQLSYRLYKNVNLWWVIAGINNINNPLEPLDPTVKLKIISSAAILNILNSIEGG